MNNSTWQVAKDIFDQALGISPAERGAFADIKCGNDSVLRAEVEKLLGAYDSDFLEDNFLGTVEALTEPHLPFGQVIGRYRIKEQIGTGGMGQVFLADDTELDRPVAFKVLHRDVADEGERVRRFIQEAKAASALNHPNILTIHEIGSFEGSRFIVSEYIDGDTLRERMRSGLNVAESVEITCQIAAALQAAHAAGIVHRDIKPENVMIRNDGLVKVLDFGLAKLTEADDRPEELRIGDCGLGIEESDSPLLRSSGIPQSAVRNPQLTAPGLVMGTVAYMSPEQARGHAVDARTDLWSLGVVLHEMLTGKSPFDGESVTELVSSILSTDVTPANIDGLPPELTPICQKALTKEREKRYQSAHDLLEDLKGEKKRMEYAIQPTPFIIAAGTDELRTQLIRPRPTLSTEYLVSSVKRHKYATLVTAATILFVGIGFSVYKYNGAPRAGDNDGVLPAITSDTSEKDLKLSRLSTSGRVYDIAISGDGKLVAYTTGETILKNPITLRRRDTGDEVQLVSAPDAGNYYWPSFSPDGKYLYYGHAAPNSPGKIYRIATSGGTPSKVVEDSDGGASVSPDGRFLAFSRDLSSEKAEQLLVANADGTQERVVINTPYVNGAITNEVSWIECDSLPAWSPDSKKIACGRHYRKPDGEDYYKRVAIDISTGSEQELSDKKWRNFQGTAWLANGDLVTVASEPSAEQTAQEQLWVISPGAQPRQISDGPAGYKGLTATRKGDILTSVRKNQNLDLWVLPQNDTSRARQITSSGELTLGQFGWMSDGRIAFESRVSGSFDLWIMNPDGTGRKQLTSDASTNNWGAASPDGRYIVFTSNRGSRGSHLYRMNTDGSNLKQLTMDGPREWSPKISPDGKWVYYIQIHESGQPTICRISIDGGQPTVLTTKQDNPGPLVGFDVSRDGRVAYATMKWVKDYSEPTFFIIPPTGGKPVSVIKTRLETAQISMFRWTPDGKSIAYNDLRNGAGNIWTIPADGKGKEKQLTNFGAPPPIVRFTWSPDGKQLLVSRVVPAADGMLITNKSN